MYRRKNRQNEIKITLEDVELIMGKEYTRLNIFLNSAFCASCSGTVSVINYQIYLDDVHDIIFDGVCGQCHSPVSRYIETGISQASENIARHIRMIKKEFDVINPPEK
jgi:hypothetical protein